MGNLRLRTFENRVLRMVPAAVTEKVTQGCRNIKKNILYMD
jgi:hypothetical protein